RARCATCGTTGRATAPAARAAAPSRSSGDRSWVAASRPGLRGGRRWGPAEKTARTRAARLVPSCGGASERLDQPLLHDLFRPHQAHALVAPLPQQVLGRIPVDATDRVGDHEEPGVWPALQQALHRRLVARVGRDPVQHDVLGVEYLQRRHHVRVAEHVEAMLVEEDVAPMDAQAFGERLRIARPGLYYE